MDGYLDVILVISSNKTNAGSVLLGINKGWTVDFANTDRSLYYNVKNDYKLGRSQNKQLSDYKALSVSFFDFDESGFDFSEILIYGLENWGYSFRQQKMEREQVLLVFLILFILKTCL